MGLYEPAHLGWLENEDRIGELCADPSNLSECYQEMLGPKVSTYPLHSEPDTSSSFIGDVIVVSVPGRPLSAHFRPIGSRQGIPFTLDLFLPDWATDPISITPCQRSNGIGTSCRVIRGSSRETSGASLAIRLQSHRPSPRAVRGRSCSTPRGHLMFRLKYLKGC